MLEFVRKNYYIKLWHDYEFSKKYNWIEFCFVNLRFEYDRMVGSYEIHIAFIGLHFFWNYGK